MNHYLLLIHGNATTAPESEEWESFFEAATQSGMFKGGSEIGDRELIGNLDSVQSADHIRGYMRFDADEKQKVLDLLNLHPVVKNGGTVELCSLVES